MSSTPLSVQPLSRAASAEAAKTTSTSEAVHRAVVHVGHGRAAVGLVLVLLALGTMVFFWIRPSSSLATVAGSVSAATTHIAGTVGAELPDVGDVVDAGQVVARMHNPRLDESRLLGLLENRAVLEAKLHAIQADLANGTRERTRLRATLDEHLTRSREELEQRVVEEQARLASLAASERLRETDLAVAETLYTHGLIARLDLARKREEVNAGIEAVKAQASAVARVNLAREALARELFLDAAQTPHQQLRLDDLAVRLTSLETAARELEAQIAAADRAIASERAQVSRLQDAVVLGSVTGRVWKRLVSPGQYVAAGTELVQIIPDSSLAIEAYFHQRHLPDVTIGSLAVVLPTGSRTRLTATVRMITADVLGRAQLAAPQWTPERDSVMRVVLAVSDTDKRRLWVGQRVTVSLPSQSRLAHATATLLSYAW